MISEVHCHVAVPIKIIMRGTKLLYWFSVQYDLDMLYEMEYIVSGRHSINMEYDLFESSNI